MLEPVNERWFPVASWWDSPARTLGSFPGAVRSRPELGAVPTRGFKVLAGGREGGCQAQVPQARWEMDPSIISGLEEASPEPAGAQVGVESQEELTSGLDVGECEKRAREMLGVGSRAPGAAWYRGTGGGRAFLPPPLRAPRASPPPWAMGQADWV